MSTQPIARGLLVLGLLLMASRAIAGELLHVEPFVSIVGGLKVDNIIQGQNELREGRVSAMALSTFGLRGSIGELITFHSEMMANGGTSLHGSSAWEGQAALQ